MVIELVMLLVLLSLTVAGLVIQYFVFVKHISKLEQMMFAGNPVDYQKLSQDKKVTSENRVKDEPNQAELTENSPMDISEVTGVQVDDQPQREVKIYKT